MSSKLSTIVAVLVVAAGTAGAALFGLPALGLAVDEPSHSMIVQAASVEQARAMVREAGGTITHELGVIRAVAAQVTDGQLERLRAHGSDVRIYADRSVASKSQASAQAPAKGRANDRPADKAIDQLPQPPVQPRVVQSSSE